jgi:C4-dicarboxylate-specific signal transduction histidine kinase
MARGLDDELRREYADIVAAYLRTDSEDALYAASLFGRKLVSLEQGPEVLLQVHFAVQEATLGAASADEHAVLVRRLGTPLFEALMVFCQWHQEVRGLMRKLQKQNAELDALVVELKRSQDDLREKTAQLVQTEKMTALGRLAAGVAHEINQPLNAIRLTTEDVLRDVKKGRLTPDELGASMQEVVREVKRMAEIIDHMRRFTRRTEGHQVERVPARAPVEGVVRLLGQQLKLHGVELHVDIADGWLVPGDPVRLEQVFMNLIGNAWDAVRGNDPSKGMAIRVSATALPPPDAKLVYAVTDNGTGMPKHVLEKIFEPFYTEKPPGQGTGLGLSVCRQIIDEHNGRIDVESVPGEGTTFRVTLPLLAS